MIETLLAIIGVCLGFGMAGILLLFGALVVLLLVIREVCILVRWILGGQTKKKIEKEKEDDK